MKVPYYDQWRDTHDKKWAGKTCAICCLKMILAFKNKKYSGLKIMDLVNEGLALDGLTERGDWKHKIIVELANKYGVRMKFRKRFFYAPEEKLRGLRIINSSILRKKPALASVFNRKKTGGHMVVINGLRKNGRAVVGYYILDPDSRNQTSYFIGRDNFLNHWRGGLILLKG